MADKRTEITLSYQVGSDEAVPVGEIVDDFKIGGSEIANVEKKVQNSNRTVINRAGWKTVGAHEFKVELDNDKAIALKTLHDNRTVALWLITFSDDGSTVSGEGYISKWDYETPIDGFVSNPIAIMPTSDWTFTDGSGSD